MVIAMALPLALHLLAAVVWVGGMFYAYLAMRPAVVQVIDPARRPALWAATLERFFRWVWAAVVLLLATGFGMVFGVYKGMANVEWHIHAMNRNYSLYPEYIYKEYHIDYFHQNVKWTKLLFRSIRKLFEKNALDFLLIGENRILKSFISFHNARFDSIALSFYSV